MNALLEQFLSESRDFLQGIGEKLMQLENEPTSMPLMTELFRYVHTLKGNSGLFDFPEMTRVLHASEDLMDAVRNGHVSYSQELADELLEAMDFVGILMDEIESTGKIGNNHIATSAELAKALRALVGSAAEFASGDENDDAESEFVSENSEISAQAWTAVPQIDEAIAEKLYLIAHNGNAVIFVEYTPDSGCFFKGEDPFFLARQIPDAYWQTVVLTNKSSNVVEMDVYDCQLIFQTLTIASDERLDDLFRYVPDEITRTTIPALAFVKPHGIEDNQAIDEQFIEDALALLDDDNLTALTHSINTMLSLFSPELWSSSVLRWMLRLLENDPHNKVVQRELLHSLRTLTVPDWATVVASMTPKKTVDSGISINENEVHHEMLHDFHKVIETQRKILTLGGTWSAGRLKSVATTLQACYRAIQREYDIEISEALENALTENSSTALLDFINLTLEKVETPPSKLEETIELENATQDEIKLALRTDETVASSVVMTRRNEETISAPKTLKVDQEKIDRLMNLIGEMVVAKNALPYLANRAESVFGVRDLSREIKAQYAVINRVAEEMQDTIMQVRMMPVSFIFQRFPRMVRDISRKLGKEVDLVLEGQETEADKNIVEALADPLIHIVRNSLDHGLEQPDVRRAAGKNPTGRLMIRASQESDRVLIEIIDDGRGINPVTIKNKAYEKGLIDESTLERISDQDAINLVFAAGFSTADVISDLSGRGVGMDVVRSAVERVNGTVGIESEVGKGTRLYLSLPLSMAVTNVIIIESNQQIFGVPMDMVVETVRVPSSQVRMIKQKQTTVLRGRVVPLLSLNSLLACGDDQQLNDDGELATLIVRVNGEHIGILVDDFRETVDIILKPMVGILGGLSGYSGAALLGDGSVLMVLNPRELI